MKMIRVGVVGVRRGAGFARGAGPALGMQLVAICDTFKDRLEQVGKELKVQTYTDYRRFLEHEMDAVILANYYHQHVPLALQALQAGLHVMSETTACATLAEGVALTRAVEKSRRIYMFAENYPYSAVNQEMRRLYRAGAVGEFKYGEGAYVHPDPAWKKIARSPGFNHWRNWIPATYYCTHSMAPIMFITSTRPVTVNGFVIPRDRRDPSMLTAGRGDTAGIILCQMNNDAVVRLLQGNLRCGGHVRICGNRGHMETCPTTGLLRLAYHDFEKPARRPRVSLYAPDFPIMAAEASKAGHGGGDYFMNYYFAQAIQTGKKPFLDVYRGVDMSIVGILAYRSALNRSCQLEVPDFRQESVRRRYEQDDWSPDPDRAKPGQPYSSVLGNLQPLPEVKAYARRIWKLQKDVGGDLIAAVNTGKIAFADMQKKIKGNKIKAAEVSYTPHAL